MSRDGLRIIGIFCLGISLLSGFAWREAYLKVFPIDKESVLKAKQVISASFVPEATRSEKAVYLIDFQFKGLRKERLRCSSIRELPVKWAFSEDVQVRTWNRFPGQNFDCQELEDKVFVRFQDLEFKPGINQHLYVSLDGGGSSNSPEIDRSSIRVRLIRSGDMDFHYGSLDIELAALATAGCFSISIVCGLIDLVLSLKQRLQPHPNNSDGADWQD